MYTMRQLAIGEARESALDIAAEALAALSAKGSVHVAENVGRVLAMLRSRNHTSTAHARALACALCAACAHVGAKHAGAPRDAEQAWCRTEEVIETWFAGSEASLDAVLLKVQ